MAQEPTIDIIKELAPLMYVICGVLASLAWKLFNKNIDNKDRDIDSFKDNLLTKMDELTKTLNKMISTIKLLDKDIQYMKETIEKHDDRIINLEKRVK